MPEKARQGGEIPTKPGERGLDIFPAMAHGFRHGRVLLAVVIGLLSTVLGACASTPRELKRHGDEIMVCGRLFRIGAPVVLWTDPGGYDAYRVDKRFVPLDDAPFERWRDSGNPPQRYSTRRGLSTEVAEQVRGGGWSLEQLRARVDQFVIHYDVCGTSRTCFRVLHDQRFLSVHFMLDIDGTIYQTLDLKERAWHATTSNDRSIGIEIAHIGAYPDAAKGPLAQWYAVDETGRTRITIPSRLGDGGVRTPNFIGRPAREGLIVGTIQGTRLEQHDFTPQQYDSLIKLAAALARIFPRMPLDYPRDEGGRLVTHTLEPEQLAEFRGVLGHYHIQKNKIDPGPAFDFDRVIRAARRRAGK